MALTFSEPVDTYLAHIGAITIQSSLSCGNTCQYHTFTSYSGIQAIQQDTIVVVNLTTSDLNRIKQLVPLATSLHTTYLSISSQAIADMALVPNQVVAILPTAALPAAAFTADSVRPVLLGFSVDMSSEQMVLTFDETVNASSLQPTAITLLNAAGNSSTRSFTLTGGTLLSAINDVTVSIQLVHTDVNQVKKLRYIFTEANNSFVSATAQLVMDMAWNAVEPVEAAAALPVNVFVADTVPPQLVGFNISMNGNGSLWLTFDETVKASTFDPSKLVLQNSGNGSSSAGIPFRSYALTGGLFSTAASADSTVLTFVPLKADLDAIKLLVYLAVGASSSFVNISSALVTDMVGNNVVPATVGPADVLFPIPPVRLF
jgi:hypothetical protein